MILGLSPGVLRVAAIAVGAWLFVGGCSSSTDEPVHARPMLDGAYETKARGEFQSFEFRDASRYLVVRNEPCARTLTDANACVEEGTFTLTDDTLTLTEATTGRVTTLPFAVVSLLANDASTNALRPTTKNGANVVRGGDGKLVDGQASLAQSTSQLTIGTFTVAEQPATLLVGGFSGYVCRAGGGYCSYVCGPGSTIYSLGNTDCREQYGGASSCCKRNAL